MNSSKPMTISDLINACTNLVKNGKNVDYYAAYEDIIHVFVNGSQIFKIEFIDCITSHRNLAFFVLTINNSLVEGTEKFTGIMKYTIYENDKEYRSIKSLFKLCQKNNKVLKEIIRQKSFKQKVLNEAVNKIKSLVK